MSDPDKKRNIFIAGMMGSGKSTIGAAVAKQLFYMFIDTDANIETIEGMSVRQIFEEKGEPHFRERERIVLEALLPHEFQVVATGGGMLAENENLDIATENGFVVLLEAPIATLAKRLANTVDRPLLAEAELETKLNEIELARKEVYQSIPCKVDTGSKSIEECTEAIIECYNGWLIE